jgi:hypothetical protein
MKMKNKLFQSWAAGAAVAMMCLSGGRFGSIANAQDQQPPPPADNVAPDTAAALPPGVYPSSPLAQVIKLTQAGVSEAVIMAYVTNSGSTFNLNPDKIIFMKDIGAPDELVTAMMQRDQVLQAQMAAAAYQPPPQTAPPTDTTVPETTDIAPPPTEVTVDYFYDTLAPYGGWVNIEGYGLCWQPTVVVADAGWQPYCDHGHWVYTDDGWYWLSDYSWGWAPFHYGRWFRDARFGWCWAPDTVWGPSWVTWRYSADYCGWAPLPPFATYVSGIGFTYRGAAVSVDFDFGLGVDFFTFVPTRNFCDPHLRLYRVGPGAVAQIYSRTTVINNFDVDGRNRAFINHGIAPERITAVTRTEIHPVSIRDTTGPVARGEQLGRDGRTLIVNRPHFADNPPPSPNRGAGPRTAPPSPVVGSPYQPLRNANENNNSQPPNRYQPAPPTPAPGQRQIPPAATPGSPGRNGMAPPAEPSSSPDNRYAPVSPVPPPAANNNNSTDNRRYPSPRMVQTEQQSPRVNPGNTGERVGVPAQPPPLPPPVESRPNYSQPPPAGNPSRDASAPASPPAQSQRSGRDKNQN